MTHAPSTYKIPTANDCPPVLQWSSCSARPTAPTPSTAARRWANRRLLLAFAGLLAIKDACAACGPIGCDRR